MPNSNLDHQIKHDGAMQPQTQQQHEQQLQNLLAEDYFSLMDIWNFNVERTCIRIQSDWVTVNRSFPTPRITPDLIEVLEGAPAYIPRPHVNVLDTRNIEDDIWYSNDFQLAPGIHAGNRDYMDVIEIAYIANYLTANDAEILQGYKEMFEGSEHSDDTVLRVINEVRWKAKEQCWSTEETQLIADAFMQGIRDADTVFARFQQRWHLYPKSRECVRRVWSGFAGPFLPQEHA